MRPSGRQCGENGLRPSVVQDRPLAAAAATLVFAGPAAADHHAVKVAKKDGVGSYLADAKGMTLYFLGDKAAGDTAGQG